jgi:hypothetical protein
VPPKIDDPKKIEKYESKLIKQNIEDERSISSADSYTKTNTKYIKTKNNRNNSSAREVNKTVFSAKEKVIKNEAMTTDLAVGMDRRRQTQRRAALTSENLKSKSSGRTQDKTKQSVGRKRIVRAGGSRPGSASGSGRSREGFKVKRGAATRRRQQ